MANRALKKKCNLLKNDSDLIFLQGASSSSQPRHPDLTPQKGRELWRWAGEGYRRPGGKGKSKKLFFRSIQRGKDRLHVNDCAVFLSTGRSDRPYIGKIEMLWETGNGSMMVKVKWFYHPEEIETCGQKFDLKLPVSSCNKYGRQSFVNRPINLFVQLSKQGRAFLPLFLPVSVAGRALSVASHG